MSKKKPFSHSLASIAIFTPVMKKLASKSGRKKEGHTHTRTHTRKSRHGAAAKEKRKKTHTQTEVEMSCATCTTVSELVTRTKERPEIASFLSKGHKKERERERPAGGPSDSLDL